MKKTVISVVVAFAALVAIVASLVFFLPVSAHMKSTTTQQHSPTIHCGAIVAGAKKQPCLPPPPRIIPLRFTDHWSQQVWVPQVWSFRYICNDKSTHPAFDILDEYNASLHSTAWEVYMRLIPLTCNNRWHTESFRFRYAHIIVIGVSRPMTGVVGR